MPNRKVPVKERVCLNIQAELKKIRVENGFNFDVTDVIRTKQMPSMAMPSGTILMGYLDERRDESYSSTHHDAFTIPVEIYVFGDYTKDPDSEFNYIQADIVTKLSQSIYDNFHPNPCQARIITNFVSSNPWYTMTGQQPIVGGWFEYEFTYRHTIPSVYKWDSSDHTLLEEEISSYEL